MRGPKLRCNTCKTEIASQHRHDFRTCNCKSTDNGQGTQIFIDGGPVYTRIGHEANADWEWVDKGPVANAASEIREYAETWFDNPTGADEFEATVNDIIWKHISGEADEPPMPF